MTALTPETTLVRAPGLVAAEMDGDVVMMSVERGQYYGLGAVGGRVWELMERPISIGLIARTVSSEYAVDEAACLADILSFAADLVHNGIAQAS